MLNISNLGPTPVKPYYYSQDSHEGGLNQFLRGHPALGLTKYHVYLNKFNEEARGTLPFWGTSVNSYNQQQDSHVPQTAHPQVPEPSDLTWQMANSGRLDDLNNPELLANLSLDMELEKCVQGGNDQTGLVKTAVRKEWSEWPGFASGDLNGTTYHCNIFSGDKTNLSLNEDGETFHSIMKEDKSILMCYPKGGPETNTTGFHAEEVSCTSKALSCDNDKFVTRTTAEKSTSAMLCFCTRDMRVGSEHAYTSSALTQTEESQTADKHVNTEVCMFDMDSLTKEYITIKTERDGLLKEVNMQRTKSLVAKKLNDLKILESEYNKKREKILAGIFLQDIKPLSLDSEETDSSCIQTKMTSDAMTNVALCSHQHQDNSPSEQPSPHCENAKGTQDSHRMREAPKIDANLRPEDLNPSEAWYDAEEELPSAVNETQENSTEAKKYTGHNLASDGQKTISAVLCVSGLPNNATESDVMLWFDKYLVSEVHISALKELRVAIVTVGSHHSAEAAVRELSGKIIEGHMLQVNRINAGSQEHQVHTCTSDLDPLRSSSKSSSNQLTSLTPNLTKKKVVCISPTAQGTFVPQHYSTMGSFDIIMSKLTQRHPGVTRERIVDALLDLRAKYRGVLSGLPLRAIREMTSELLTQQPAVCKCEEAPI